MPAELMDAIGRGERDETLPAIAWPQRKMQRWLPGRKPGTRGHLSCWVERHEGKIFSLAHRMTRNREDAEDVVQQSFQKGFHSSEKVLRANPYSPPG